MSNEAVQSLQRKVRAIHIQPTTQDTLDALVGAAVESLPHFEHVGISLAHRKKTRIETIAASSALVTYLDNAQYGLDEGPCYDSIQGADFVKAPDLQDDPRWPRYTPEAREQGVVSQMAFRLYIDDKGTVGGLNLYSTSTPEISETDVVVGNLFATHAAAALGRARDRDNLTDAIESRQTIGMAIGILMERHSIDREAAQNYLWRTSSTHNVKVRDLAVSLLEDVEQRP